MEYTIPVFQFASMVEKIASLNKRAVKLGIETHLWAEVVGGEYIRKIEKDTYDGIVKRDVLVCDVKLHGDLPKLDGWQLIAVLSNFEGQVLIEVVPGETVDTKYWSTRNPEYCDHCHTNRKRNDTFLVRHEDGRMMQVGRQCLRDFLGHNANALMTWGNLFAGLNADIEEMSRGGGGWGDPIYKMENIMPEVVAITRKCGWLSRTKARESYGKTATADTVLELQRQPRSPKDEEFQKEIAQMIAEDATIKAEAQKIIEFVQNAVQKDDLNDYEYNLSVVYNREVPIMNDRTAGIACSAIAYYQNSIREKVARESAPESNWLGVVGDKITATVTVYSKGYHESDYGTTVRINAKDADGNVIVTFGSGAALWDMEEGETYTIKGKIKKLDEFRGVKQTSLSHVKLG